MKSIPDILRDVPEAFETERLRIRLPRPGDGPEVNAAVLESLENLRPWMPWAQQPPTLEQSEESVRRAWLRYHERTDLRLHLYHKESGAFVGGSGLHRMDWSVPKFEIGYWCRARFEGQGLITEAVVGIARVAFDVLLAQRLEIRCDACNTRSRRVAERGGFLLEGELRNDARTPEGALRNTLIFSMTADDFRAWALRR